MKKIAIALSVFLLALLAGCEQAQTTPPGSQPSAAPPTASEPDPNAAPLPAEAQPPDTAVDNRDVVLEMSVQEYEGYDIVEIPYFSYDETNPTLAQFGGSNPELDGINRMLRFGLIRIYEEFQETRTEDESIEIRSYPFTDEAMIQVVITQIRYPTTGTDGDLQSINFSRGQNKMLLLDEVMTELGLTQAQLSQDVIALYKDAEDVERVATGATATGFLIRDGKTILLLEVETESPATQSWKQFYSYEPQSKELIRLPPDGLFDRESLDELSPPLTYDRVQTERGGEAI